MAEDRDFFAPVLPALTEAEVAHRLHRASAHPHLAAELATAVFTAASVTQLASMRWVRLCRAGSKPTATGAPAVSVSKECRRTLSVRCRRLLMSLSRATVTSGSPHTAASACVVGTGTFSAGR